MKKILLMSLCAILLTGCGGRMEFKRTGFYLDNVFEVNIKVNKKKEIKPLTERVLNTGFGRLVELDTNINRLSPISEVSAINSKAGVRTVDISQSTYDILKKSIMGSILTDGYFDITWQPLSDLFSGNNALNAAALAKAKAGLGYDNILLDKSLGRVRFANNATVIDFSPIKQGFAIDLLVGELQKLDSPIKGYIKAGNVRYIFGKKKEVFKLANGMSVKADISNKGVATVSGDDKYYAESGFWKQYLPVVATSDEVTSVIVIAPNASTAQVLASAFYFMGPDKAFTKLEQLQIDSGKKDLYNLIMTVKVGDQEDVLSSLKVKGRKKR